MIYTTIPLKANSILVPFPLKFNRSVKHVVFSSFCSIQKIFILNGWEFDGTVKKK
jgi:hypothetical protein